jgi:quinol monooxygenase YgiN
MFNRKKIALLFGAAVMLVSPIGLAVADEVRGQFVLVAELEIDPSQLESFKAAAKEDGETAVRVEPGCLAFNVVYEKDNPGHIRFFEVYTDADAFKAHLETAHFKKYAAATKDMVKSRKRIDSVPMVLYTKGT